MARAVTTRRKTINPIAAWGIGLLIFFPILWTILTSFKTEAQAINDPPLFLFFDWTLENYSIVQERSDYMRFLWNSVIIAGGSTLLGIIIAAAVIAMAGELLNFVLKKIQGADPYPDQPDPTLFTENQAIVDKGKKKKKGEPAPA